MAIAGLVLLAFLMNEVVGNSGYLARRAQQQQIQELNDAIEKLQEENSQLTLQIQKLRSDPDAIEEMAREQLHLGRPGEVVVALPPDKSAQP